MIVTLKFKVEATDVAVETDPKQGGEAVVSFPPVAQAGGVSLAPPPFVGSPWSTGLFDCHEDKTNGKRSFLFILSICS